MNPFKKVYVKCPTCGVGGIREDSEECPECGFPFHRVRYWCWICIKWITKYEYLVWARRGQVWRRINEIKWVILDGKAVPICPFCKNPLTKQPKGLIFKSWIKYALIVICIFFVLRIVAKIVELAS